MAGEGTEPLEAEGDREQPCWPGNTPAIRDNDDRISDCNKWNYTIGKCS